MKKKTKIIYEKIKQGSQILTAEHAKFIEIFNDDLGKLPSVETEVYWIGVSQELGELFTPNVRSGKWLLFISKDKIDETWKKIQDATKKGLLGYFSKVSTAKSNKSSKDANARVICVYTYDYTDEMDRTRVRNELRKMGFTNKISYKTNASTRNGKYFENGDKNISSFFE